MKICSKCKKIKAASEFYCDKSKKSGLIAYCKVCDSKRVHAWKLKNKAIVAQQCAAYKRQNLHIMRAIKAKYRASKLQRIPKWSDLKVIKAFYANCPQGLAIDHIVPLQGKNVCGLHVFNNLQYLTPSENSIKKNKFPFHSTLPNIG